MSARCPVTVFRRFRPFLRPSQINGENGRKRPLAVVHLERGDEGRLRDLDVADLAHPLLALLLLLEKLLLAADVAAVALGQHVLAQRADRLARNHPAADRRLDGDLEELAWDQLL